MDRKKDVTPPEELKEISSLMANNGRRAHQETIKSKCFHPSGVFTEFSREDVQKSISDRFEHIVSKYPHRIAVKAGDHIVTYAELNALANSVAHTILARVEDEADPVGLLLEKGLPQIAAMLGVLKTGKFFVLLDPAFPKQRITDMLADSGAELLVTNQKNALLAQEVTSGDSQIIDFESTHDDTTSANLGLIIPSDALAYISYTSGSTGQPKGVLQNNRNILHDVMVRTNAYHIGERDRLSLLASGTSHAIKNVFLSLLNGATLLPFDVHEQGVNGLARWLSQEGISICRISSPLFRRFCETLTGKEGFFNLRLIVLASETIYISDVELYKKYFSSNCILATGVSSTETGLMRDYLIDHATDIGDTEVPVGYPVEDKEILLLDDAGHEIRFNEVGEIAVRSCYLSPGYWRLPELTKDKFKPDDTGPTSFVYHTGDLGLMLPDGLLFHKGRKDFRVKVRGYGVEIREVETALSSHPAIGSVIVVAGPNDSGEARLVAYFTTSTQPPPTVSELQRFLRQKVPDYMVPSAFITLETLPLTAAGKIDRDALPEPGRARPRLDTPFVAPATETEKRLAEIWAEVLCIDKIGLHDNFFDLGGHSLAATRITARIIKQFEVNLPVQSLFQSPTLADMATAMTLAKAKQSEKEDLNTILSEFESLSDEDANELLANQGKSPNIGKKDE